MAHHMVPDPAPLQRAGRRAARARLSARAVPDPLATVLRRAHAAEQLARGEHRIPAFRLTRYLIAGARHAGYSTTAIAECLGSSVGAVRTRGGSDGWVADSDFADLAGLDQHTIDQWADAGLLPHTATDDTGERYHAASDFIEALDRHDPQDRDPR